MNLFGSLLIVNNCALNTAGIQFLCWTFWCSECDSPVKYSYTFRYVHVVKLNSQCVSATFRYVHVVKLNSQCVSAFAASIDPFGLVRQLPSQYRS